MSLTDRKIAFIGVGRMGQALLLGILRKNIFSKDTIFVFDKDTEKLELVSKEHGVIKASDPKDAVLKADIVILAVKPQNIKELLEEIKETKGKLFISIAAGVPLSLLNNFLKGSRVIRSMPNAPALVGKGITAIALDKSATKEDLNIAKKIFSAVGKVIKVKEKEMDAVTALSGSGPAYVYEAIADMVEAGITLGLKEKIAFKLALQTFTGAIETLKKTKKPPKELAEMVKSPGGTTIEGFNALEQGNFKQVWQSAFIAAAKKSADITQSFA